MKCFAFLLLAVAFVHAYSSKPFAWEPSKEYTYRFESQVLTGIPEIREQYAGLKLLSKVKVQAFPDFTLRVKLEEPRFTTFNGLITLTEAGRIIGSGGPKSGKGSEVIPEEFKRYLEQPFLVHLKRGMVQSFYVATEEPTFVTNIKKSLLAQLQVDITGSQRTQLEDNHIQLPVSRSGEVEESGILRGEISYFANQEESLHGECMTEYNIHPLPSYRALELEEEWENEEKRLGEAGEHRAINAKLVCEGKKYYQINKIRSFDQCKVRPVYQQWTGVSGSCDTSKSSCKDMLTSMSSTTMIVCAPEGELTKFIIRKVLGEDEIINAPMGWNTKETLKTKSLVSIELLEMRPLSGHLPVPSGTKEEKSLIYNYPLEHEQKEKISEEKIRETEELIGQRPVLPQPSLTGPQPPLVPLPKLPFEEVKRQVVPMVQEVARLIFESPESCTSQKDVAGKVMAIANYGLKLLSLQELKQLQQVVIESGPMPKIVKELWMDILAITGSNPAVMLVKENIEQGKIVGSRAGHVLSTAIRNIKTPTQELMKELVKMVKRSEPHISRKEVLIPTLLQLSNVFYRAYVNPSTMVTQYPVKIYGVFGNRHSEVLTREYIPFLVEKLFSSEHEELKLTIISALGKTGHLEVVKPLLKLAETPEKLPVTRSLAIYSLKRVAKRYPVELKSILSAIINNPVENEQVRMAAIATLPWTKPTVPELQKLAIRSWFEPSKQVSSFIVSTLKSLAYIEVPELKYLRPVVRPILSMVKPHKRGVQFSQNLHSSNFVEYLKTAVNAKLQVTNSKTQLLPTRLAVTSNLYGHDGLFKVNQLSLTTYMQGMERLLNDYLYLLGKFNKSSQHVQEQLKEIHEKLNIEGKKVPLPEAFVQMRVFGYENAALIDYQKVEELMEEAVRQIESESGHEMMYNHIRALQMMEMQGYGMTATGFPVYFEYNMPLVVAIEGKYQVKTSPSNPLIPYIQAKVTPVINAKLQSTMGIISPFTRELLGSGVEMGLHTSLPVEIEVEPRSTEVDIIVKNPVEAEQRQMPVESFHLFSKPYTVAIKATKIMPITKGEVREIVTGKEIKKIVMPIGESIGIKGHLYSETDVDFNDLYSYYIKLIQHNLPSLSATGLLPSTVRKSITKLQYYPKESETKEMKITLKLSTKEPSEMGYESNPVYSRINPESLESNQLHNIKRAVEQLEREGSSASLLHLKGSLKGRYNEKAFHAGLLLGSSYTGSVSEHVSKTVAALDIKSVEGKKFGILYEGLLEMPRINFRWSKSKLLEENPELKYSAKLEYGLESEKKEIKMDLKMEKTHEHNERVRQSPEWKLCEVEESKGLKLAPVCMKVRHEAASLDKVKVSLQLPLSLSKHSWVNKLGLAIKGGYIYQIEELEPVEPHMSSSEGKLMIEAVISRIGDAAQVYVKEPSGEHFKIKNIRLGGLVERMLPLSVRIPVSDRLIQKLTFEHAPASCRIQPGLISTFDNRTYTYKINNCEHLLVADRTMKLPVAVLARSMPQGENKIVKILSGHFDIKMIPQSPSGPGKQLIKLNEKQVELTQGQIFKEKSSTSGKIMVEIKRYVDDVYFVSLPEQGLQVLTNGKYVEVIVPQLLKSKTAGVCGDNNGEITADLKSPRMCVMKPKIGAVSYILNKSGSPSGIAPQCEGIPSQYRQQYKLESQKCFKEIEIPTKAISILMKMPLLNKPVVSAHVVDKQRNQICISKQKIKICSGQSVRSEQGVSSSKPVELKPKLVSFVCIQRPSSMAESLEKRALAGESLYGELIVLPTRFRKTEMEPVACKPSLSQQLPLGGQEQDLSLQEQQLMDKELLGRLGNREESLYGEKRELYPEEPRSLYGEERELYPEEPRSLYGEERELYPEEPRSLYGEERELYTEKPRSLYDEERELYTEEPRSLYGEERELYPEGPRSPYSEERELYPEESRYSEESRDLYNKRPYGEESRELYGRRPYGEEPRELFGEESMEVSDEMLEQGSPLLSGSRLSGKRHWGVSGKYGHLQLEDEY